MNNINWTNDKEVDALIRSGLLLANKPADELADTFIYSPRYLCWEQKMLAKPFRVLKQKSRTAFRFMLEVAAVVFITIAVIFTALMAASPGVRAAVVSWFRELLPTHVAYHILWSQETFHTIISSPVNQFCALAAESFLNAYEIVS